MLHKLTLFKDVKITPDYSVVHDMTPSDWKDYLVGTPLNPNPNGDIVWEGMVNYYRLPDVIRVEGNYDTIRKVTYGMVDCARGTDETQLVINESMERPMFFFVKNVRLIRQESRVDKDEASTPMVWDIKDVVELEIAEDVWSNNNGSFELYDSYIERRHMDRWKVSGGNKVDIYYANAGQGVDGSYLVQSGKKLIGDKKLYYHQGQADEASVTVKQRCFLVMVLDDNGQLKRYLCMDPTDTDPVYYDNMTDPFLNLTNILDGSFYTITNTTSEFVQAILCLPYNPLMNCLEYLDRSGTKYIHIDTTDTSFTDYFDYDHASGHSWITMKPEVSTPVGVGVYESNGASQPNATYLPASDPTGTYDHEEHEPMLYRSPARARKIVTGIGGTVVDIPDIKAFDYFFSLDPLIDLTSGVVLVYMNGLGSGNVSAQVGANVTGALGSLECATLPIYNSAWRSYEAINKVGDEIAYQAKQFQTVANGITGTASSAIMGGFVGGPYGAALGLISGSVGTAAGYHGNEEELRSKQVTIRNSPSNVKSGGSGLAAYQNDKLGPVYVTLKIDDQSFDKLRQMYYWFGYIVNRTFKGTIDLSTRKVFDFIKTNGAKVRGDLTAGAAQQIADIFDRGVSIYHGDSGYDKIGASALYNNDEDWL